MKKIVVYLTVAFCIAGSLLSGITYAQGVPNNAKGYDFQNTSKVLTTASTNATTVNIPVAGQFGPSGSTIPAPTYLRSWYVTNTAAYTIYIHFYDTLTAPVVGTTPTKFTIAIPAGTVSTDSGVITAGEAILFKYGLAYSVTKGSADTDTTVTIAGDGVGAIFWD